MKKNASLKIEVKGHTDSQLDFFYNMDLSQERADKIRNYMIASGIDADRIVATGFGERKPVNECLVLVPCSQGAYAKNRRTEFVQVQF